MGLIIRTAGMGREGEELQWDLDNLRTHEEKSQVEEGLTERWAWPLQSGRASESYQVPALGLIRLPTKYAGGGVEADRRGPMAVHASAVLKTAPPGRR